MPSGILNIEQSKAQTELDLMESVVANRQKYHADLLEYIKKTKSNSGNGLFNRLSVTQKYLNCLETTLGEGIKSTAPCESSFPRRSVTPDLQEKLRVYTEYVLADDLKINLTRHRLMAQIPNILSKDSSRDEMSFIEKDEIVKCSPETPAIDLEETGVFKDISRDHQDSIGSCYANTARNLLLGISEGEVNASFLDLALSFKKEFESDFSHIDGGSACKAVEAVSKRGYCDKNDSPLENGRGINLGLINGSNSLIVHSEFLDLFRSFLENKKLLVSSESSVIKHFLENSNQSIVEIKNNPLIKLPFPHLGEDPFLELRVLEAYHINKQRGQISISEFDFRQEWGELNKRFHKKIAHYINPLTPDEQIEMLMQKHFEEFFRKYKIGNVDHLKNKKFSEKIGSTDKNLFQKQLLATENFLSRQLAGHPDAPVICEEDHSKIENFSKAWNDIIDWLRSKELSPDVMFDNNQLISEADILQLAVAPNCLNPENRKKINFKTTCAEFNPVLPANKLSVSHHDYVRSLIIKKLKQGIPIGNSFPSAPSRHVNTIVGIRYNTQKKTCEFKIRESQNATSSWSEDIKIINRMDKVVILGKEQ